MRIARVFPRRTKATPDDNMAFVGECKFPLFENFDRVHVSVSFTWDIIESERIAATWEYVAPVEIGGPALKSPTREFVPGEYLKHGYVITSRGCPKKCWFCPVWKSDPAITEYTIRDGWMVQDDNLLACSEKHIRAVFAMLKKQPHRAEFTGGLEPAYLKTWHVDLLADLNPKQIFSAYDTPDDHEPLVVAGRMLQDAGFTFKGRKLRCYVLIGFKGDTFDDAGLRMLRVIRAGFWPMAMLWRDQKTGRVDKAWSKFQRIWTRPAIIAARIKSGEIAI